MIPYTNTCTKNQQHETPTHHPRSREGMKHNESFFSTNEDSAAWKQKKEFRQIVQKRNATRFSGENPQEYRCWKERLQEEVQDISPTPVQWIEILEARTSLHASKIVKNVDALRTELGASKVVVRIWRDLDKRYATKRKPSQDLLQQLQTGPHVRQNDEEALWDFAHSCINAVNLMDEQDRLLLILNEEPTQNTIAHRLEEPLLTKWIEERKRYTRLQSEDVPFRFFSEWIEEQASIQSDRLSIRRQEEPQDRQKANKTNNVQ